MNEAFNNAEVRRLFDAAPFITGLGVVPVTVDRARCETALDIRESLTQQDGLVHAGVIATMADHTAGAAAATLLADGQYLLTVEFNLSLLRAATGDRLRCVATVLKPGRQLAVVEAEVFAGNARAERLVAKARVTLAIASRADESARGDPQETS